MRRKSVVGLLALALLGAVLLAGGIGAVLISPWSILSMALDKAPFFSLDPTWTSWQERIIFQVRLPRVVGGALVGAALATAGVIFQGLLRNPMADPYIIGTSAGAALGATLALLLPWGILLFGFSLVPLLAFAGALASVFLVYNLARVGGRTPIVTMLLAGFAVSSMLAAVLSLLMTSVDRLQVKLPQIFSFLMGGIAISDWRQVEVAAPLVLGGILVSRLLAHHLNAFALGEEGAAYLGIPVERDKVILLAVGSLLTAAAVSLSGLIGFVGLVVPHAMRVIVGPDHRVVVPASALGGATFLVLADLAARSLLPPTELPVGVLTALLGAPFFLYLLKRGRREYAF